MAEQQTTSQIPTTIPTTQTATISSVDLNTRTRFEQQTADMGKLISDKKTIPINIDIGREPSNQTKKEVKVPKFAPTNLEDEKTEKNKFAHGFDSGGDTQQARDLRQQLIRNRIADVENPAHKNPFAFTHPLDRQAATFAKAQRIIKNSSFAALPEDRKNRILGNYYDKYVVPVYQNSKIEPPAKDVWVGQIQKGFFKTSDFYEYSEATNKDAASDLAAGVVHTQASAVQTAGHLGHAILMAGVKVDRKLLGITNFFPGSALHSWTAAQADFDARFAKPALKLSQDVIDRTTFWLDTHPSRSYTEKAGSFVGENLVQLPLYETIAAPLGAIGKVISSTGKVGKAANFTRRLATSKAGQFAGRRLAESSSAYVGDIFSEAPEGQRSTDMALFMGLGIGGEALTAAGKALAKPISRTVMKKVVATNVAVGGKVFHETIADQAAFELEHNIVGTDAAGDPIVHDPAVHGPEDFHNQMAAAQAADPVKHSLITAEKLTQNAMARQLYNKPVNQLSQLQRRKVRVELAKMTSEATEEIPIHVPEVAHSEVERKLAEDVQINPELAQTFADLEKKYGAKIVDSVVQTEQDSIAVEHGIKSTQGATARIGRNEEVLAAKNAELGGGGQLKSIAKKAKTEKTSVKTSEGKVVNEDLPKSYVSFKTQTMAHFTNPFNTAAAHSKTSLTKFLEGMDDADFVQEISDQMGNQIKFEKSSDMLLWGLHHSESIPSPIINKIKKVLHNSDPNGTFEEWKDEGRRLSAHIDMLAMSGRLDMEGNVFRSTITTSFTGRTKWQKEAEKEASLEEIENFKNSMAPYAKNFKEEYNAGLKELAKLQSLRRTSKTDADFFTSHDKIKKILEKAENK